MHYFLNGRKLTTFLTWKLKERAGSTRPRLDVSLLEVKVTSSKLPGPSEGLSAPLDLNKTRYLEPVDQLRQIKLADITEYHLHGNANSC